LDEALEASDPAEVPPDALEESGTVAGVMADVGELVDVSGDVAEDAPVLLEVSELAADVSGVGTAGVCVTGGACGPTPSCA